MTPPTLNDSRISSFEATMPSVEMVGAAGPEVAVAARTGVGSMVASLAFDVQAAKVDSAATQVIASRVFRFVSTVPRVLMERFPCDSMVVGFVAGSAGFQRHDTGCGGVIQLGLPGQEVEPGEVQ